MQAIPLQRPLGWLSVLWSNFPAAEDAIASKQLDILSGGIAVPCVHSHPNGCECSAAGLGGRTRSPDPPLWRESGPWQTNIPPVFPPFAFTPRSDSRMLGSWPRLAAIPPTPKSGRLMTTPPRMRKTAGDLSVIYRQRVADERSKRVTDTVRAWLVGDNIACGPAGLPQANHALGKSRKDAINGPTVASKPADPRLARLLARAAR